MLRPIYFFLFYLTTFLSFLTPSAAQQKITLGVVYNISTSAQGNDIGSEFEFIIDLDNVCEDLIQYTIWVDTYNVPDAFKLEDPQGNLLIQSPYVGSTAYPNATSGYVVHNNSGTLYQSNYWDHYFFDPQLNAGGQGVHGFLQVTKASSAKWVKLTAMSNLTNSSSFRFVVEATVHSFVGPPTIVHDYVPVCYPEEVHTDTTDIGGNNLCDTFLVTHYFLETDTSLYLLEDLEVPYHTLVELVVHDDVEIESWNSLASSDNVYLFRADDDAEIVYCGYTPSECYFCHLIRINVYYPDLYTPNVITPNQNGSNEYFTYYGSPTLYSRIAYDELTVYNRWGGVVHHEQGVRTRWYPDRSLPTGVYVYLLVIYYTDGSYSQHQGDVTLVK